MMNDECSFQAAAMLIPLERKRMFRRRLGATQHTTRRTKKENCCSPGGETRKNVCNSLKPLFSQALVCTTKRWISNLLRTGHVGPSHQMTSVRSMTKSTLSR